MLKKLVMVWVAVCIMFSAFTGCKKTGSDKDNQGSTTEEKKYTIKWMGPQEMPVEKDSTVEKFIEEKFNVEIEAISVPTNYNEKLGAMIASNEIPDVMFMYEPANWQPLAEQGILAEVSLETIQKYAPNHYQSVQNFEPKIWSICKFKDKNWVVPKITDRAYNTVTVWRQDWLDKLGIEKIPETISEFEEAFIKITNGDPDGNGKKDTYGLTGLGGHAVRQFDAIFGAYGIMPGQWRVRDGKVVMSTILPEAKEVIALLHEWYKKGLIDPEFITDNVQTTQSKFESGRLATRFDAIATWMESMPSGKANLDAWKKRTPEAKITLGPLPAGPNGERGDWQWGPRGNFVAFSVDVEKEPGKMEKILSILDQLASDEELAKRVVWGEKGRTYDQTEPDANGRYSLKYLPPYDTNANERAKEGIGQNGFFNMLQPTYSWAQDHIIEKYLPAEYVEVCEKIANWNGSYDALMRPYLPSTAKYQAHLDKLKSATYSDFIRGYTPLSEWDTFVQNWLDQGGRVLTEEAQKFYDENMKK